MRKALGTFSPTFTEMLREMRLLLDRLAELLASIEKSSLKQRAPKIYRSKLERLQKRGHR